MEKAALKVKRQEISLQNASYCLCIVLIHLFSDALRMMSFGTVGYQLIFFSQRILFCAIYGFIFLSGLKTFINPSFQTGIKKYYIIRIKKILLPYFFASLIYWLMLGKAEFSYKGISLLFTQILKGEIAVHFYFVIAISQFYLIVPLIKKIIMRYNRFYIIAASLIINLAAVIFFCHAPLFNRIFLRYLFCYMLGCYAGVNYDNFTDMLKKHRKLISCIFIFALSAELYSAYTAISDSLFGVYQQIITTLYMPIAILFLYSLFLTGGEEKKSCKLLTLIDGSSYHIYLWHVLILQLTVNLLNDADISNLLLRFLIQLTAVIIGIIIIFFLHRFKLRKHV